MQTTEDGTFLHVCSFPAMDVFLYVETQLEVVERSNNTHLYSRTVCVEDHREKFSDPTHSTYFTLHIFYVADVTIENSGSSLGSSEAEK